ncbi:MAG: ABC transporter substrate-binding protein [Sphaerochaetaceae bacterium]|nr:ABC transporter substrate-binding protein [Sphaerochaetaceae bacterium]
MKKILSISLILLSVSSMLFSQGTKEVESNYVASTSWTASYAYVGGLDNVISIAPADLVHPPEYEILPSDIKKIQKSKAFIFAGYEVMMDTLSKNIIDEDIKLQIQTVNTLDNIKSQAKAISEKYGTQEKSNFRVHEIEDLYAYAKEEIKKKGLDKKNSYVHFHQVAFAKSLGLNVVGSFGPNSVSTKNIEEISKLDNVLIIDNVHNQLASPLEEVNTNATKIVWRNFPNVNTDDALFNMLKENIDTLINVN